MPEGRDERNLLSRTPPWIGAHPPWIGAARGRVGAHVRAAERFPRTCPNSCDLIVVLADPPGNRGCPGGSPPGLREIDVGDGLPPWIPGIDRTGALGKSRVRNIRTEFDSEMRKAPGAAPMIATTEQYNLFGEPARLFYMEASMKGIPARILHAYVRGQATMRVRVASIFDAVKIGGPELSRYETVTVLNDMCVLAPAALIDRRLNWIEIDSLTTGVDFVNGPHRVSAVLHFNDMGELIDFHSDDRGALQDAKTFKVCRWWTPLEDYQEFNGSRVATHGETIWDYPGGKFTYGVFRLKKIEYNVSGYRRR